MLMILGIHIVIAITSVLYASYLLIKPTTTHLRISYGLVGATLTSGTLMVLETGANMLRACVTGLIYTAIVSLAIYLAQRKLARATVSNK